jgi:DNA-binding transcriptional MocR family regulator
MLRLAYASRRDALAAALREHLPAGCWFTLPAGGYFLWVTLPPGLSASALLPIAERHAVAFAPGRRFCADGDDRSLRLAFSLYDEASLAEGARRLGAAIAEASGGA